MDGTSYLGIQDDTVENISIEGFVFIGSLQHSLWASKPGSITFKDCEFRDFTNSSVPIMLDYYDAANPSTELVTTFIDCEFRDNRYHGLGAQTALIYGNTAQSRVIMESSLFENNNMVWNNTRPDTHSFLIESLGPVDVKTTCFQNNAVGASDVVVFGNTFTNDINFVSNSSGQLCPFSSVFETITQFDSYTPTCVSATETFCNRYATDSPTSSPTTSPSSRPTAVPSSLPTLSLAPSLSPSSEPTITARPTITPQPSDRPTATLSDSPTITGQTASPTLTPTNAPVLAFVWPTEEPIIDGASSSDAMTLRCDSKLMTLLSGAAIYTILR